MLPCGIQYPGNTEIPNFEIHIRIDKHILRFEIAMEYLIAMHEPNSQQQL